MRRCMFSLLMLTVLVSGGCAQLLDEPSGDWYPHLSRSDAGLIEPSARTAGGGATEQDRSGPQVLAPAPDLPYFLDSGDELRIFVYGQPNLSRLYKVDHSGKIMMPFIGLVRARRRTTYQLAKVIRTRLGTRFVRNPEVTVNVQQNRPFFILGEVRNPGQFPYVSGMTVETAVAIAGGYTARALGRDFRISRRAKGVLSVDRGSANYVVQPGDTIRVGERFF